MVYKHVSIYNIIEKLYRDYDHQEELDIWDCVEWAADALEFIGAGQQYARKTVELTITNSIAPLPCDFHSQPLPSFRGKPLSIASGGFSPHSPEEQGTSAFVNGQEVKHDNIPITPSAPSYYIRDGVFVTSINSGVVLLDYRAVTTDKEGFPTIPDLISYRQAVTSYVQMKLDHKDWRKKRIGADVYGESKSEWQWYCKQAKGVANMPNLSTAEGIKNMWVKLKPNRNSAQSFYNDLHNPEMKKIQ